MLKITRRTLALSIPETRFTRRVDFLSGKAPGHRFGIVVTISESSEPVAALVWFGGAKRLPTLWRPIAA